jgi:hypothetical protein
MTSKYFTRALSATLIALSSLVMLAFPAVAQQPTPCGGAGGTGTIAKPGGGTITVTRSAAETLNPPTFLDAKGVWTACEAVPTAPAPSKPFDCGQQGLASGWAPVGGTKWMCSSPVSFLDAGYLNDRQVIRDVTGSMQGTRVYRCERRADGSFGWVSKATSCGYVKR